jgi:hypothetical protein
LSRAEDFYGTAFERTAGIGIAKPVFMPEFLKAFLAIPGLKSLDITPASIMKIRIYKRKL